MNLKQLHEWHVDYSTAAGIQRDLAGRVILRDEDLPDTIELVAGADVSCKRGDNRLFAVVVVLSYPDLDVLEEVSCVARADFPYIPGLLTFREGPVLLEAFRKLTTKPDVVIFDGQGIAHPRGFGLAAHLGLILDVPSIGCAKTRLVGEHGDVAVERGAWSTLEYEGAVIGTVLRTKRNVNPVYVSPGHKVSVDTARQIVLSCSGGYRIPEPTRQAHIAVNRLRIATVKTDERESRGRFSPGRNDE
jgi:deoxyribonuclease V